MILIRYIVYFLSVMVTLKTTWAKAINDTDRLVAVLDEQSRRITELEALIDKQSNRITDTERSMEQQSLIIDSLKSSLYNLQNITQRDHQEPFVGFDVTFSDDPHRNVSDNDVMVFDKANVNIGDAYNTHDGTFQAPVSGLYVLYMKVTPSPMGHIYVYLVKDGIMIDSVDASDDQRYETGSSVRIVQLAKGDRVWMLKSYGANSVRGWAHTMMSGYLLRAK